MEIKRVQATNWPWRYPNEEEIKPGTYMLSVDLGRDGYFDRTSDPVITGTIIKIDHVGDAEIGEGQFKRTEPYVWFHCIYPFWEGQCFVPLTDFLGPQKEDFGHQFEKWLPTRERDMRDLIERAERYGTLNYKVKI